MKLPKIFSRYPIYLLVGAGVTIVTVLLRSLIGLLIEYDTTSKYMSSIILAYVIGIFLSFLGHKSITFKAINNISSTQVFNFIAIHLFGMSFTLIGSNKLRENFMDTWFPIELSKMLAFAVSAFVVSIITCFFKKHIVFDNC